MFHQPNLTPNSSGFFTIGGTERSWFKDPELIDCHGEEDNINWEDQPESISVISLTEIEPPKESDSYQEGLWTNRTPYFSSGIFI